MAAEITNLIIEKIEQGVPPWKRPWRKNPGQGVRPRRHCGTPYTGINALYLWALGDAHGYASRYWMTFRQALALGGNVRKGESGAISVYYSSFKKTETNVSTGMAIEKDIRFLRHYHVFNADQIDGLAPYFYEIPSDENALAPSEHQAAIDTFFAGIPAQVRHGGDRAYFSPTFDYVQMPRPGTFETMDHYASTRLHETVHWTGHTDRLARAFGRRFGDNAYAFEELVAEIGAGLGCAELGLPSELHENHASYVAHWLSILRADKTAIIHAAAKAEQAMAFLRSFRAGSPENANENAGNRHAAGERQLSNAA